MITLDNRTYKTNHDCDGCLRPIAPIATIVVDDDVYRLCRYCRFNLKHGRLTNIVAMLDRIFSLDNGVMR